MNGEDEGELPEGWATVSLREIASMRLGKMLDAAKQNIGEQLAYLRNINVRWGRIELSDLLTMAFTADEQKEFALRIGDVLICEGGEPGRAAVWSGDRPGIMFQKAIHRVRLFGTIEPSWLVYHLRDDAICGRLEEYFTGSTIKHFTGVSIARYQIRLAPLAEQRRIVAGIERALAYVNAARDRLNRVPAILKRFRQSVLAAACSGRLTADWREKNLNVEPADKLVSRILANSPRRTVDAGNLPELPDNWTWLFLPETGEMNRGKSRHRPRNAPHLYGGPHPFIQTGDIANSGGRITTHRQSYSEAGLAQSRLWPVGTVCITIAANIADSAILTYPACFPDSVVGVVTMSELCLGVYLEYFLRTARDDLAAFAPATAQANINIAILNDVAVPIPPHPEQQEIVRRVDALFKLADRIEAKVTAARQRVDTLTQAVLAKAFRGELVPTEAELARRENRPYEPAADLLARIRTEREKAGAAEKPKRTRRTSK